MRERKNKIVKTLLMLLVLAVPCFAGEAPSTVAELAAASGQVTVCEISPNAAQVSTPVAECQKRDTARLFLIAGKPNAALRLLCDTQSARVAYGDDYEAEHHQWIHPAIPAKCLRAVGLMQTQ